MSQLPNENREDGSPPPPPPPPPMHTLKVPHMSQRGYRRLSDDADILIPRPSILLPQLQEKEKKFFDLVSSGDIVGVKEYIDANPAININCTNFQGVTALLIAVQSHGELMVEFLLTQPGIDIGDCVLHAVKENQPNILVMLLDKLNQTAPSLEFVGVTHSSDFPDYVTPLILAAQCGHYEIIKMLIERGHTISKPHPPTCRCNDCRVQLEHDDLLHAESLKLNLYRAVSNPAYICYSTHDPILAAFHLSQELQQCSFYVPEFKVAYSELSAEISNFAVDLIACCRSTNEMELILTQGSGMRAASLFVFPRLVLAMDYKQKTFVAHPNTQQIVEAAWCGDWHEYKIKPFTVKLFYPIIRVFLLPVITVMSLVSPNSVLVKHWSIPLNRMISHISAYSIFLIIIFLESNIDKTGQKRKPPNSGLEPIIVVFVVGYIWNIIRMFILLGPKRYFRNLWNWHAVITNILFLLTFMFWLASYFDEIHYDQVDLERKYWHHLDPVLVAEGCFAVATIMAFFKLMFFCRLNYYMGPLQISLGKMCADLAKYIMVFTIVMISFSAGLCRFYQSYDGMIQVVDNDIKTQQVSSFIDFSSTLKTLFWAIFCMAPLESADVIIENLPGDTPNTTIINSHTFTEAVGYIAFALFEVLIVIMILNMLIATMSSTFQRVIDNLDVEWTFGKTDFYLEYMVQSTTPPPFNLIPTLGGINDFMELIGGSKMSDKKMNEIEYPALMTLLVQRYFREKDTVVAAASEMDILRQEIHELKFVYLEKNNYTYENHTITTADGYVLLTVRLPYGKNSLSNKATGPPVIFMHCILCTFYDFLNAGPGRAIGFEILEQGYDVWLLNIRGNTYSRKHITLDPDLNASAFWNFSWHEAAIYDVPANIDYITNLTGFTKVSYVGHSQGGTIFLAMAASKPEYNEKITLSILLSPVSYLKNAQQVFVNFFKGRMYLFEAAVYVFQLHEVLPRTEYLSLLAHFLCNLNSPVLFFCEIVFEIAAGPSTQTNNSIYSVMATNAPAGASINQMRHFLQNAHSGEFRLYDYGIEGNIIAYDRETPPDYNLSAISSPVAIYYGSNDVYVAVEDAETLADNLPNVVLKQLIPYQKTNHLDVLWGTKAVTLVHTPAIMLLNKYNDRG